MAHPGLAAQAADDRCVYGGHGAVHVGVVDGGNGVALRSRDQVLLDRADLDVDERQHGNEGHTLQHHCRSLQIQENSKALQVAMIQLGRLSELCFGKACFMM